MLRLLLLLILPRRNCDIGSSSFIFVLCLSKNEHFCTAQRFYFDVRRISINYNLNIEFLTMQFCVSIEHHLLMYLNLVLWIWRFHSAFLV